MPGPFGCFVDSLAETCLEVTCLLHESPPSRWGECDYRIRADNVHIINLGIARSIPYRALFASRFVQRARPSFRQMDILLIRGPSPLLPQLARAAHIPIALLLVGDYLAGIGDLPQPRWRMELIRLWARWNNLGQRRAMQHALTFVNSQKLYNDLRSHARELHLTRTSTLSASDFFERADTCQTRPIRLLYVGRLSVIKGLSDILAALSILTKRGEDLTLDLVGAPDAGEADLVDRLTRRADELGVRGRVHFAGRKSLGADLSASYRAADIFVNATSSSEGFPRTIWEAMANSLPVVATRVGSIPDFVAGAAELTPPRNPDALADAIARLIHNESRRREIISAGYRLAQQNTLELRAREMTDTMQAYLET